MTKKDRLVSGMRPTGKLHIGHWQGALINWINLQDKYSCFYFIADWHALTTKFFQTKALMHDSLEMLIDWLSVGLDYKKCTIFQQSMVKNHAELYLLLSMVTPLGWLERCPTYKEMKQELSNKEVSNLGFLGYPVLQTADIVMYNAKYVPVGEDQLPHLELTREIIRRFHHIYKNEVFTEPKALLTKTSKLLGTDGRKMSKSYNNSIYLSDIKEEVEKKVRMMITDETRIKATDLGHPDKCSVFYMQQVFNKDELQEIETACKKGQIGCVACKKKLADVLNLKLDPIREERNKWKKDKDFLMDILKDGSKKAEDISNEMMTKIREIMHVF